MANKPASPCGRSRVQGRSAKAPLARLNALALTSRSTKPLRSSDTRPSLALPVGGFFVSLFSSAFALLASMRNPSLAIAAGTFLLAGIFQLGVASLDRATRDQCAAQAWPVYQHAAHLEFCREYGYSTSAAR